MSDTTIISKSGEHRGRLNDSSAAPREGSISPRRRGAPLGNHNALRHGFYARDLGQISPRQYDEAEMRNLLGEAAMLKDFMYKLYTNNSDSTDSATLIETLRALSLAGMALARVLQVHNDIRIYGKTDIPLDNLLSSLDTSVSRIESLDL